MNLVTGGHGFLGRHFCEMIDCEAPPRIDCGLESISSCMDVTRGAESVYHLAADVGGIEYLKENPAGIFYKNLIMGLNMLEASRINGVNSVVLVGSVCEYPEGVPMREGNLNRGEPVKDTEGYGWAKRTLFNAGEMYRKQYGMRVLHPIFTNLYGPGDGSSHVVAQLVRKFCEAKKSGDGVVDVWGNGEATRDLLHVSDAARMLKEASEQYYGSAINLATGVETTIRELAETIAWACDFTGKIRFVDGPVGEKRRKIDVSKAISCGIKADTDFKEGIQETVDWYKEMT